MITSVPHARGHAAPAGPQASPAPATYLPLLRRMVEDLRDAPAALGAYALIARLYLIQNAPVPLSPGDLRAYDPALSYGAARRALGRLADAGYVLGDTTPGRKAAYVPTWGLVGGAPHPWDRSAPLLGQPRHLRAVRLDDRLLDLCLGRLRPSAAHAAVVERYVTAPLLGLRDVGGYALALAGLGGERPALNSLGLLSPDGSPLPLPDNLTILAIASQRLQAEARDGLTPAGYARAGLAQPAPAGQALFFV
ncbi:MAG: hypothetical protein HGA45_30680, partial [Chloroflexales bacterium]|nr:hypothetical protein [Chloroflexales bacterium]